MAVEDDRFLPQHLIPVYFDELTPVERLEALVSDQPYNASSRGATGSDRWDYSSHGTTRGQNAARANNMLDTAYEDNNGSSAWREGRSPSPGLEAVKRSPQRHYRSCAESQITPTSGGRLSEQGENRWDRALEYHSTPENLRAAYLKPEEEIEAERLSGAYRMEKAASKTEVL